MAPRSPAAPSPGAPALAVVAAAGVTCALACGGDAGDPSDPSVVEVAEPAWGDPVPPRGDGHVRFEDVAEAAGLTHVQSAIQTLADCRLESVLNSDDCEIEQFSGGVAVGDVNADGVADLVFTALWQPVRLYVGTSDHRFVERAVASGIDLSGGTNGAAFADIDADGDEDLFVSTVGEARFYLYVNDGTGRFTEEAIPRQADRTIGVGFHRAASVAPADWDGDGYVDLVVAEWAPVTVAHTEHPLATTVALRNRGVAAPGHFEDVTAALGLSRAARPRAADLAPGFVDFDGDGHTDMFITADFTGTDLYWGDGRGRFVRGSAAAGVVTGNYPMSSAIGDFDADGDLDWFVAGISCPDVDPECGEGLDEGNKLYRYAGGRRFDDATDAFGVRFGKWAWGAAPIDFDNDGDLDLAQVNGWRAFRPENEFATAFQDDASLFWRNDGVEPMSEIAAESGFLATSQGRAIALFDYERDGDLDMVVVVNAGRPHLYRNVGGDQNDWLRVAFVDASGAPSRALNTRIRVTARAGGPAQLREAGVGAHFLSQSEGVEHFGLGAPRSGNVAEVAVTFAHGGGTIRYLGVPRNETLVIPVPRGEAAERIAIRVAVDGAGETVPGATTMAVARGAQLLLVARPRAGTGEAFQRWEGLADATGLSAELTAGDPGSVTAVFGPAFDHELIVTAAEGGSVWPSAGTFAYRDGQVAELTAVPAQGWKFDGWTGDTDPEPGVHLSLAMTRSRSVTATFSPLEFVPRVPREDGPAP